MVKQPRKIHKFEAILHYKMTPKVSITYNCYTRKEAKKKADADLYGVPHTLVQRS